VQLHGIASVERIWHVGIGHRMPGQSAGLVVLVMTGHGVLVVRTGGNVTMLVMTGVVVGGRGVGVGVGVGRRVVGHATVVVRNSMPHP
jgi:hypothetical protein